MARALGSKVYPNRVKEIGWKPLELTTAGQNTPISYLQNKPMFHWHGDTFDLPQGAQLLASTPECTNQIYSYGKNSLAFQCHPEVSADHLEKWWIGHAAEMDQNKLSPSHLRQESQKLAKELQPASLKCLQVWLDNLT